MALVRFVRHEITGYLAGWRFTKRGCTYQHEGGSEAHPNGWMTRDPHSNDWILWDVDRNRTVRLPDIAPQSEAWVPSKESLAEFLRLADTYNKWLMDPKKYPVQKPS